MPLINEDDIVVLDWEKKYETKTSYVLRLKGDKLYNITLESVI
jgi:hypothetical protein